MLYPELVSAIAAKTGESEEDIRTGYKGIRYEVLGEGRYFPNPYSVKARKYRTTLIGTATTKMLTSTPAPAKATAYRTDADT